MSPLSEAASEKRSPDPATLDGGDSGISEAASDLLAADKTEESLREVLRDALPRMTDEERAEQEKWEQPAGRGRPRVGRSNFQPSRPLDVHHKSLGHYVGTEAKTGRGRQEAQYAAWGMTALFEYRERHPEVLELTGIQTLSGGRRSGPEDAPGNILRRKNIGILAEFGRLVCKYGNGEEVAVQWAVELVRMRPRLTSKQAVAWLRQRRLQKSNLGKAEDLLGAITTAVDGYLAAHPGTSNKMIIDALNGVMWLYSPDDDEVIDDDVTNDLTAGARSTAR